MYCRNCAHQVNDKAIACPKCGVNPRLEKKFCPSCGTGTNANQVACTSCGISLATASPLSFDASSLQNIDIGNIAKNKAAICAGIAVIGFFMSWIKYSATMILGMGGSRAFSGAKLSEVLDSPQVSTILSSTLLYLLPILLIGIILSDFVPQVAQYRKILVLAVVALVFYAAIGLFTIKIKPSEMDDMLQKKDAFSVGIGFYISFLATLACAFFSGLFGKK